MKRQSNNLTNRLKIGLVSFNVAATLAVAGLTYHACNSKYENNFPVSETPYPDAIARDMKKESYYPDAIARDMKKESYYPDAIERAKEVDRRKNS